MSISFRLEKAPDPLMAAGAPTAMHRLRSIGGQKGSNTAATLKCPQSASRTASRIASHRGAKFFGQPPTTRADLRR
ncbi:hypothetical protein [Burkholderia ubonensis]|uniref:hypothetical protein n=1 Tax=Burkholderia ubonensis TaxID=101571 RepID=UPI0015839470|nr:hypothetical protein [Burkholderia ubonensis]